MHFLLCSCESMQCNFVKKWVVRMSVCVNGENQESELDDTRGCDEVCVALMSGNNGLQINSTPQSKFFFSEISSLISRLTYKMCDALMTMPRKCNIDEWTHLRAIMVMGWMKKKKKNYQLMRWPRPSIYANISVRKRQPQSK